MEEVLGERQRRTCAGKDPEGASSLAGSQWSGDITSVTRRSPFTGRLLKLGKEGGATQLRGQR